jgi:predicted esterase
VSEHHAIEVPRTARYHLRAEGPGPASEVWFLLHGYGQLAGAFLAAAAALARPGRLLVAPEGLSRFYLRRGTGEVGASWMTREERAGEIRDTLGYLDLLWERVRDRAVPGAALRVLGFSQGGAAAARWAVLGSAPLAEVVAWGAALPPDLELEGHAARVGGLRWTFVLGAEDDTLDRAEHARGLAHLAAAGAAPELVTVAGGHALDAATLARVAAAAR